MMSRNTVVVVVAAQLLVAVSLASAFTPCRQKGARDFRADPNDCRRFQMCAIGHLVTFSCAAGSVFDEHSRSCVPAHSAYDHCSGGLAVRQRCPPGAKDPVPHPTECAQYYECGMAAHSYNRLGWERGLRECAYPYVFSRTEGKCVKPAPGVCESGRKEPLDQCDYRVNQCESHSGCIPCHVRFPTCRGRRDGKNVWTGREGSPFYITCHQQRVQSTAMCPQNGSVAIFDEGRQECVKKGDEVVAKLDVPVQIPHTSSQQTGQFPGNHGGNLPQGFIPHGRPQGYVPPGLNPQNSMPHSFIPHYQGQQVPSSNQNQNNLNHNQNAHNQYQNNLNQNAWYGQA